MIAISQLRIGHFILAFILILLLNPLAIAYNEYDATKLSKIAETSCNSCNALEEVDAYISDATYSTEQNSIGSVNPLANAADSLNEPLKPPKPQGPNEGQVNKILYFKTKTSNPNGEDIKYVFEWWESGRRSSTTWTDYVPPDSWVTVDHAWHSCGNNNWIRVKAVDKLTGEESEWSDPKYVAIYSIPQVPSVYGPGYACKGKTIRISARTIDPCKNDVGYLYDWGDGRTVETGLFRSNHLDSQWVSWNIPKTYFVKVKAKNSQGKWSNWSSPIRVIVKNC